MKYKFEMIVEGNDILKAKIDTAIKENAHLNTQLVHAFGISVALAMRIHETDNVRVSHFTVTELQEEVQELKPVYVPPVAQPQENTSVVQPQVAQPQVPEKRKRGRPRKVIAV